MNTIQLDKCPFCGYTASIETFKVRKGYEANVHCNNCLASMPTITFDTEEEAYYQAVMGWNTRTTTVAAEPVKNGHWIDVEPAPWEQVYETCSECGIRQALDKGKDKFCGWCGARMDEVK